MKNIKYILLSIFTLVLSASASELSVTVTSNNSLKATLENNIGYTGSINWELKLFETLNIIESTIDIDNSNKVIIYLWNDILPNSSYSLLSLSPINSAFDFDIKNDVIDFSMVNNNLFEWFEWIESIRTIDSRTMEVTFNVDLTWLKLDFNLLADKNVNSIYSYNWDDISILIDETFSTDTNYILMFLSLQDTFWNNIDFWEWVYDFTTSGEFIFEVEDNIELNSAPEEDYTEEVIPENIELEEVIIEEDMIEKIETDEIEIISIDDKNELVESNEDLKSIEEIAMEATRTPDTWASEIIILLLAMLLSLSFVLYKKEA